MFVYTYIYKYIKYTRTLQKLVNRTVERYVKDEDFRKEMNEYLQLQISGSQF
jgi:hypothetical protein